MGHIVHIFTTTLSSKLPEYEEMEGVIIHRLLVPSGRAGPLRFSTRSKSTKLFLNVDYKIKFNILNPHSAYQVNYNKIRKDLKIIYTVHAVTTYEYLYQLEKIILNMNVYFFGERKKAYFQNISKDLMFA